MLSILRRNTGSWAIKIILSFIALTFIWWGVGTYSEQGRNVAATVGGEAITANELAEAVAGLEKSYREVYGTSFTPEMAKALNLKKQAMDSLVQRKILLAEAGTMGLSATDEEVQREIAAIPAFQQDGVFREDRYRSVLSYNRVGVAEFEASKRVEITLKKVEGLLAAGALVPETEAKELFRVGSRKIRLLVVTADPGKASTGAPTEGEILAKYEQAKERFRTPARVKLAVAAFTPDRFGREVQPSEAEIKAYYETNSDRFPEGASLSRVRDRVVEQIRRERGKDLAVVKAYEAQPKAVSSKSAKATAATYGVPVVETGWVGAEGSPGVPAALVQDALLLPSGEVAPVKTLGDVHYLFQVTEKEDSRVPPLSAVRDKVGAEVAREKKAAAARAALQQVLATSNTAAELETNARKAGLSSSLTDWFAPLSEPAPKALAGAGDLRKDISNLSAKAPVLRKAYPGREGVSIAMAFSGEQLPSDAEWAEKKAGLLKGLAERKKNETLEAFLSDRRKSTKVEINPEALK